MTKRVWRSSTGSIAFVVVLFMAFIGLISGAMQIFNTNHRALQHEVNQTIHADDAAQSGIQAAIDWFQRQHTQPVRSSIDTTLYPYPDAAFYPRTSTSPVTSDTIDESIGLVKEFPISESNHLWGRYEVNRQMDTTTNPLNPNAVHDISDKRVPGAVAGDGLVWLIQSHGYVFYRRDSSVAFNVAPNEIIGQSRMSTEIHQLHITLPTNAAVIARSKSTVTIGGNGEIKGGTNTGLAYWSGTTAPSISGTRAELSGTPALEDISTTGNITPQSIFGMSANDLKMAADFNLNDASYFASAQPSFAVVTIQGDAVFSKTCPLRGSGILFIDGNMTVQDDSNSIYAGLIYVTGNVTIASPTRISGAMVIQGSLNISGFVGSDDQGIGNTSEIIYDNTILNIVRQKVTRYRASKLTTYAPYRME